MFTMSDNTGNPVKDRAGEPRSRQTNKRTSQGGLGKRQNGETRVRQDGQQYKKDRDWTKASGAQKL